MGKDLEIIIIDEKNKVGQFGKKKRVKKGYFFNYLEPNNLAITATKDNLHRFKQLEKNQDKKIEKQKEEADSIKKKLENKSVVIETKADKGKIYGSITTKKIAAAIKESHKVDVQENSIRLTDKIKQTGNYDITIELVQDISFKIKLEIQEKAEDKKKDKKEEKKQDKQGDTKNA